VITDGHDGFLVGREDVGAMTQAITRLLENKNLSRILGENAKETAKRFDISISTEKLFKLYVDFFSNIEN